MQQTGLLLAIVTCFLVQETHAEYISLDVEMVFASYTEQEHAHYLVERRNAIPDIICPFQAPPKARLVLEDPSPLGRYHSSMAQRHHGHRILGGRKNQ